MSDDVVENRHALVSARLRDRRRELGLTQKQVVTRLVRLGVRTTNKALSCQEHGAGLDVAKLPDLARALECTTTYLLGLTDDPGSWEPDRAGQPLDGNASTARGWAGAAPQQPMSPPVLQRGNWILGPEVPDRFVGSPRASRGSGTG